MRANHPRDINVARLKLYAGAEALDLVRRLVSAGADVNAPDDRARTPLLQAILTRDVPRVRLLLQLGAASSSSLIQAPAYNWPGTDQPDAVAIRQLLERYIIHAPGRP